VQAAHRRFSGTVNPAIKVGDRVGILGSDIVGKVINIGARGELSVKPDGVRLGFRFLGFGGFDFLRY
jgi:hypothetical protein